MSYTDILTVIAFADADSLDIADRWLATMELKERGARMLATFESRKARRAIRSLVTGER